MGEAREQRTATAARRGLISLLARGRPSSLRPLRARRDIVAAQYGNSTGSMPYAWRWQRVSSRKPAPTSRGSSARMVAAPMFATSSPGQLAYAESALPSVITAIQKGADLVIVSDNVQNAASIRARHPAQLADPERPRPQGQANGVLHPAILHPRPSSTGCSTPTATPEGLTLVSTSGFGPGLTALENNGVDLTVSPLPNFLMAPVQVPRGDVGARRVPADLQHGPASSRGNRARAAAGDQGDHRRAPQGRRVHGSQPRRIRRHHRQGLSARPRGDDRGHAAA